jgi:hypothetical protein
MCLLWSFFQKKGKKEEKKEKKANFSVLHSHLLSA